MRGAACKALTGHSINNNSAVPSQGREWLGQEAAPRLPGRICSMIRNDFSRKINFHESNRTSLGIGGLGP